MFVIRKSILLSFLLLALNSTAMEENNNDHMFSLVKDDLYTGIAGVIREYPFTIAEKHTATLCLPSENHPFIDDKYLILFHAQPTHDINDISWYFQYTTPSNKSLTGIYHADTLLKEFSTSINPSDKNSPCYYYHTPDNGNTLIQASRNEITAQTRKKSPKKYKSMYVDITEFDLTIFTKIVRYFYKGNGTQQVMQNVKEYLNEHRGITVSQTRKIIKNILQQKEEELRFSIEVQDEPDSKRQKTE